MATTNPPDLTVRHDTSNRADEAAIGVVIGAITNAVRANNVDAMLSHCASDIAIFDMVPPLKHKGAEEVRQLWTKTLTMFEPPLEYNVHHLEIAVSGDVAFSRSLNRFGGTTKDGERVVHWLCSTLGFRKIKGRWKVMHEHTSVPFDMESGKALLDLKP